jgi:hypothetical protein
MIRFRSGRVAGSSGCSDPADTSRGPAWPKKLNDSKIGELSRRAPQARTWPCGLSSVILEATTGGPVTMGERGH